METASSFKLLGYCALIVVAAWFFWRYVWFFRNPPRNIPAGQNIVSPADGTVVYVKVVQPNEPVISIKRGLAAGINDIVRDDFDAPKVVIGIFMSPLDVHYNRAPVSGTIEFIRHYPSKRVNLHMTPMHFRVLLNMRPYYANSLHIVENERTVTRMTAAFKGENISCYLVQIAGGSVNGIDSYVSEGREVAKGQILGMIRIGSQVDLIVSKLDDMTVEVRPGDKVRAGVSVLIR